MPLKHKVLLAVIENEKGVNDKKEQEQDAAEQKIAIDIALIFFWRSYVTGKQEVGRKLKVRENNLWENNVQLYLAISRVKIWDLVANLVIRLN